MKIVIDSSGGNNKDTTIGSSEGIMKIVIDSSGGTTKIQPLVVQRE